MSTSAAATTHRPERDEHLLGLGQQCSHQSCLLVDFLPFKCHHCAQSFCQEHFKVEDHKCPQYDEFKHNRVVPNCPLCNIPVPFRPGQDPNVRMDQHLERECSVVVGNKNSSATPRCKKATCNKVLFAPIACDKCGLQFCPAHRFPGDHPCSVTTKSSAPTSRTPGRPNLLQLSKVVPSPKEPNTKASEAGTAALGVKKKSLSDRIPTVSIPSSTSQSKPTLPGPFNKTDRPSISPHTSSPNFPVLDAHAHAHVATSTTPTPVSDDNIHDSNNAKPNVPPRIIDWSFTPPPLFVSA